MRESLPLSERHAEVDNERLTEGEGVEVSVSDKVDVRDSEPEQLGELVVLWLPVAVP